MLLAILTGHHVPLCEQGDRQEGERGKKIVEEREEEKSVSVSGKNGKCGGKAEERKKQILPELACNKIFFAFVSSFFLHLLCLTGVSLSPLLPSFFSLSFSLLLVLFSFFLLFPCVLLCCSRVRRTSAMHDAMRCDVMLQQQCDCE